MSITWEYKSIDGKNKLPKSSRYANCKVFKDDDGNLFLDLNDIMDIPESDADEFIKVNSQFEYRLDLISELYYGTERYWWIIALANGPDEYGNGGIMDPINDVTIGTVLRIPSIQSVQKIINRNTRLM